jgi:hypothetical protein
MIDDLKKPRVETTDIKNQVGQIKDKIKAKETEIGVPISYSVGKGDREIIILAQPLQQATTVDWGDKVREVKRTRYITVGDNGIGAVDFITAVKFDATDNSPAIDNSKLFGQEEKHKYPAEGEFIDISRQSSKNNDEGFLRNIRDLKGVDKLTPMSGPGASVNIVMHDNDGLNNFDGQPALSIGVDFRSKISQDVQETEFMQALKLSEKKSKPVSMKVDVPTQATMMSSILSQM